MNDTFPAIPTTGLNVYWAPLVIEPVPGGPERFVAAIAAVSATGESGFRTLVDRQRLKAMFGNASAALGGVVDTGIASLQNYLAAHGPGQAGPGTSSLSGWATPLQGVYLGDSHVAYVARFSDVVRASGAPVLGVRWRLPRRGTCGHARTASVGCSGGRCIEETQAATVELAERSRQVAHNGPRHTVHVLRRSFGRECRRPKSAPDGRLPARGPGTPMEPQPSC